MLVPLFFVRTETVPFPGTSGKPGEESKGPSCTVLLNWCMTVTCSGGGSGVRLGGGGRKSGDSSLYPSIHDKSVLFPF